MPISAQQLTQIITVPLAVYVFVYDGRVASHFSSENNTPTSVPPSFAKKLPFFIPLVQIQSH
jgi:hypothetical protein